MSYYSTDYNNVSCSASGPGCINKVDLNIRKIYTEADWAPFGDYDLFVVSHHNDAGLKGGWYGEQLDGSGIFQYKDMPLGYWPTWEGRMGVSPIIRNEWEYCDTPTTVPVPAAGFLLGSALIATAIARFFKRGS